MIDIERAVAAAVLVRPSVVLEHPSLTPAAFTGLESKTIVDAARRACAASEKPERLDIAGSAIRALGLKESPLAFFERVTVGLEHHADPAALGPKVEVLLRELRRRTLVAASEKFRAALAGGTDPDAALAAHQSACAEAQGRRGFTTMQASVERFHDAADRAASEPIPLNPALAIGFPSLDHVAFAPGRLIVFAGRPGHGKTTLALCVTQNVAARGFGVCFFGIEPSDDEIRDKMVSRAAKVRATDLVRPHREEAQAVFDASAHVGGLPIIHSGAHTLAEICAQAKLLAESPPWERAGLRLIVVDYLQLVAHKASKFSSRAEDLSEVTRVLTRMARRLNVTVLALSAMNRAIERDNSRRGKRLPTMADLGESGSIERDASAIVFLHRENPTAKTIDCVVAKNRHGPCVNFELHADFAFHDIIDHGANTQTTMGGTP